MTPVTKNKANFFVEFFLTSFHAYYPVQFQRGNACMKMILPLATNAQICQSINRINILQIEKMKQLFKQIKNILLFKKSKQCFYWEVSRVSQYLWIGLSFHTQIIEKTKAMPKLMWIKQMPGRQRHSHHDLNNTIISKKKS